MQHMSIRKVKAKRTKLEEVVTVAKNGQTDMLSAKAGELESAFVKVYLKRG
jgi:hypothetical protein